MEPDADNHGIDSFLAAHDPVDPHAAFASGEMFDDWRVTAFLGRGGSGEVYRVVHATLGTAAALKVCVRRADRDSARDEAVCARFRHETELLAKNKHPAFPRFFGFGERDGRPWYVMELLEYRSLPTTKREIARFLLAVAAGVRHLHSIGLIHRDIKPGNILWRTVGSRVPRDRGRAGRASLPDVPVLIDLGLVKDTSAVRGHAGESLSIVDGQSVGVGTPRYAAPEQMSGDDVFPATDVYALGMLANDCFGGKPPRAWQRIIQRATAAIPAQRYANVDAFTNAIKLLRARYWLVGMLVVVPVVVVIAIWATLSATSHPVTEPPMPEPMPPPDVTTHPITIPQATDLSSKVPSWHSMCRNFTTNIVTRHSKTRLSDAMRRMSPGEHMMMSANSSRFEVVSWDETNKINAATVHLDGRTIVFSEPIELDVGREYWIVGPGVLDAQFSASSTATVHVVDCVFRNRTKTSPDKAGIDYVLDGGAYLNFTDLPATEAMKLEAGSRIRNNGMSEGGRWWRLKGPDDLAELSDDKHNAANYSATMESF